MATHGLSTITLLSLAALVACAVTTAERAAPITGPERERRAVQRVTRLLPSGFDTPIVIIDPEGVPDSAAVRRLDAFTVVDGWDHPPTHLPQSRIACRA